MIKILHVINDLDTGGAEMFLKDLVPVLRMKGINCEILMLDGKDTFVSRELSEKYNVPLHTAGIGLNIYNPFILFKLRPFFNNFDIIHTHLFPSQYWIAIAKKLFSLKSVLITTEHSSDNRRRGILLIKPFERLIYKQYRYIIAVAEKAAENIRKHLNDSSSRIMVIHNGINLNVISEAGPYPKDILLHGCSLEVKLILNVARFTKAKDHGTLIRSMLHIPEDYHLVLVGEGDFKAGFMDMVKGLKLESRIHFLGDRHDVPRILKSVDVVVMSSFYEGFSLSAIEGMASGKPFIASDVPGLHEIVMGAGLLFEPGNDEALAKIIIHLLGNKEYSEEIAEACLNRAKHYNIERTADSYVEIYKSTLSGYNQ
jgi:glycosyltransferase involved in cell wall biosynthesis